jgi:hypothetical protein
LQAPPKKQQKNAQKPLALQGERSVTARTFSAPLGMLDGLPRRCVCRDGASVVAAMMLHQPETLHGQDVLAEIRTSIEEDVESGDHNAPTAT